MPTYSFRDVSGQPQSVRAPSLEGAVRTAQREFGSGWRLVTSRRWRTSVTERAWLWRQLADALRERAPLPQALARVAEATTTPSLRLPVSRLAALTANGMSLASALAQVAQLGHQGDLAMLAAAEPMGRLPEALDCLGQITEADADTAARLRLRWIYPAFTLGVGFLALPLLAFSMRTFTTPKLLSIYQELGVTVPPWSSSVVGLLSRVAPVVLLLLTLAFVGAVVAVVRGWTLPAHLERWLYLLPGYGPYRYHRGLTIFFRTLAIATRARLPVDKALAAARGTLGPTLATVTLRAQAAVREGKGLAAGLADIELLPAPTLCRLRAAEERNLPAVLQALSEEHLALADFYARRFVTILEPTMVVVVGLLVGAFAAALFAPLTDLMRITSQLSG